MCSIFNSSLSQKINSFNHTKLFVGSLPASTSTSTFSEYFRSFGPIKEVWLATNSKGYCKGHGHVVMNNPLDACRILQQPPSTHFINDRPIFIKEFINGDQLQKQRQSIVDRRVFLTNLPQEVSDSTLKIEFSKIGPVETAYRIVSLSGKQKKFGYVSFKSAKSAETCIKLGHIYIEDTLIYCRKYDKNQKITNQKKISNYRIKHPRSSKNNSSDEDSSGEEYYVKRKNSKEHEKYLENKSTKIRLLFKGIECQDHKNIKINDENINKSNLGENRLLKNPKNRYLRKKSRRVEVYSKEDFKSTAGKMRRKVLKNLENGSEYRRQWINPSWY